MRRFVYLEIKTCEQYVLARLEASKNTIAEITDIVTQDSLSSMKKVEMIENILHLVKGE